MTAKPRRHGYYRASTHTDTASTVQGVALASATATALAFGFTWMSSQTLVPAPGAEALGLAIVPVMTLAVVAAQLAGFSRRKPRNRTVGLISVSSMAAGAFVLGWILRARAWPAGIEFPFGDANFASQSAIWLAEGALLGASVLALSQARLRNLACSFCGEWCKSHDGVAYVDVHSLSEVRRRLDRRDLVWFSDSSANEGGGVRLRFDLAQCQCEKTAALSVLVRRRTRSDLYVAREVLLSPADVRTVRALGDR